MMKNIYTNIKGTVIPEQRIQEALDAIGKTEDEVLEFLGDYGLMPGAVFYFIEMLAKQQEWVKERAGYAKTD
jgi:hypothetical protein